MAPRTPASRSAALVLLAAVMVGVLAPATASAQSGNGLYEPFPEAAVKKRAQRYIERLSDRTARPGRRFSDAELATGVFVTPGQERPGLRPARDSGAASARAAGSGSPGAALGLELLLLAVVLLSAAALTRRARARAA